MKNPEPTDKPDWWDALWNSADTMVGRSMRNLDLDAFADGVVAHRNGVAFHDNPHGADFNVPRLSWTMGWNERALRPKAASPRFAPTDPVPTDWLELPSAQYPLCPECGKETDLTAAPTARWWCCECGWEGEKHVR